MWELSVRLTLQKIRTSNIKTRIQNISNNRTRFIVISKKLIIEENADKISLIFALPHTTGSLYRILGRFSMAGLNLTKLESRPVGNGDFSYYFYVDLLGNIKDKKRLILYALFMPSFPILNFWAIITNIDCNTGVPF